MLILHLIIVSILIEFKIALAGQCRTSNDHKNYSCMGFQFKQFSIPRNTRLQIQRMSAIDCKETEITQNSLFFPNAEYVTVSCGIKHIHTNAFQSFVHLRELNLSYNALSSIDGKLFETLGELQTLNLSKNNFEELPRTMFVKLDGLKELIISHNKVSDFDIKVFDTVKYVEKLFLNNNQIHFLPGRIFGRMRRLKVLNLSYNRIANIGDVFIPVYNLNFLNLSHNLIEELPLRPFVTTQLEILDLSYNKLTIINDEALQLQTLLKLYLNDNQISLMEVTGISLNKIPLYLLNLQNNRLVFLEEDFVNSAKNLEILKIDKNPWDCSCLHKIYSLRYALSFVEDQISSSDDERVCVASNTTDCVVDRNNLLYYYNIFIT